MPIVRLAYTAGVMALVVWTLLAGTPLGALAVVLLAVALRRSFEHGSLARVVSRR